jgi:hypothetical protein
MGCGGQRDRRTRSALGRCRRGEPAIRPGDAIGVAAELLHHLPTLPEAWQLRCIAGDSLLSPKSRRDPILYKHSYNAARGLSVDAGELFRPVSFRHPHSRPGPALTF